MNHKSDISKQDQSIEISKIQIAELYEKVKLALESKVETKLFKDEMARIQKEIKKCLLISDDVENSMKYIENYLEIY